MSDVTRNVTLRFKVESAGYSGPDYQGLGAKAREYFSELDKGFASAKTGASDVAAASEVMEKSLSKVVADMQAMLSGGTKWDQFASGLRTAASRIADSSVDFSQGNRDVESTGQMSPDFQELGANARAYFAELNKGYAGAKAGAADATEAADSMGESIARISADIKAMLAGGAKWDQLTDGLRMAASQIMDSAGGLNFDQKQAGIEQIMRAVREEYEKSEVASTRAKQTMSANFNATIRNAVGAAGSINQIVSSLAMLGKGDRDIEQMAASFAKFHASLSLISAGSGLFGQTSEGLQSLTRASAAAQKSLDLAGGSGNAMTMMLARVGPVASAASMALGPIGVALSVLAAGYAAAQAAQAMFAEDSTEDADRVRKAIEDYNAELSKTVGHLAAANAERQIQQRLIEAEIAAKGELAGGVLTADDLRKNDDLRVGDNDAVFRERITQAAKQAEDNLSPAAKAEIEASRSWLKELQSELAKVRQQQQEMRSLPLYDERKLAELQKRETQIGRNIENQKLNVTAYENMHGLGEFNALANGNYGGLDDRMRYVMKLPVEQRKPFVEAITTDATEHLSETRTSISETDRQLQRTESEKSKSAREMDDVERAFQDELSRSQRLQMMKESGLTDGKFLEFQQSLGSGSVLQGIETLSPYMSNERQKEFRSKADEGQLSNADLTNEIANILDVGPERDRFEKEMQSIREQTAQKDEQIKELQELREALLERESKFTKELSEIRRSMR